MVYPLEPKREIRQSYRNSHVNKNISNYTVSIQYDRRLFQEDILASKVHSKMLAKQGIIPKRDSEIICDGLDVISNEIQNGTFPWKSALEDIHMNIEARLKDNIGPLAGKLHTARSRNDQVATDMRMFCKKSCIQSLQLLTSLQNCILDRAEEHRDLIMSGYTHLQRAQPVLFSHHMLAYFQMLERDKLRFRGCYETSDVLPLGSGALGGVPYPIDRSFVASNLGFKKISANSMDAVSDRDYLVEYQLAASICMMHLSRLAEELILWSSQEFGYITLDASHTTGSSIMPQKRNPDYAEIARGKTGRVYGNLMSILTTLKGLPLTYNRDMQEDKEGHFDSVDTLNQTLSVFCAMIENMTINADKITRAAETGQMLATDVADYLVSKGIPFREAHTIVNKLCDYARDNKKEVHSLSLKEYKKFSQTFDTDVLLINLKSSVESRDVAGGTAPNRVSKAIKEARQQLEVADE